MPAAEVYRAAGSAGMLGAPGRKTNAKVRSVVRPGKAPRSAFFPGMGAVHPEIPPIMRSAGTNQPGRSTQSRAEQARRPHGSHRGTTTPLCRMPDDTLCAAGARLRTPQPDSGLSGGFGGSSGGVGSCASDQPNPTRGPALWCMAEPPTTGGGARTNPPSTQDPTQRRMGLFRLFGGRAQAPPARTPACWPCVCTRAPGARGRGG